MGREMIKRSMVVVALDSDTENVLQEVCSFLTEVLHAYSMTDTVYEFDYANSPLNMMEIRDKLSELIDSENDMIYLWDIDKPRVEGQREFFRTTIG